MAVDVGDDAEDLVAVDPTVGSVEGVAFDLVEIVFDGYEAVDAEVIVHHKAHKGAWTDGPRPGRQVDHGTCSCQRPHRATRVDDHDLATGPQGLCGHCPDLLIANLVKHAGMLARLLLGCLLDR